MMNHMGLLNLMIMLTILFNSCEGLEDPTYTLQILLHNVFQRDTHGGPGSMAARSSSTLPVMIAKQILYKYF